MTVPAAHAVCVSHTFETGHRLPHLTGKCQSLHGHSWKVEVSVDVLGPLDDSGIVINFSDLKAQLRAWIDTNLDHGLMLGGADPLIRTFAEAGYDGKLFVLDAPVGASVTPIHISSLTPEVQGLYWPTVENVAEMLGRVAQTCLEAIKSRSAAADQPFSPDAYVSYVTVSETSTNDATWISPPPPSAEKKLFPGEAI